MVLNIDRKKKIEFLSVLFLLLMGGLSNYIEHSGIWNALLILCFLSLLFFSNAFKKTLFKRKGMLIWVLGLIIFCLLNLLFVQASRVYLVDNLLKLFKPLVVAIMIITICKESGVFLPSFLVKCSGLINLFWIINLIVLSVQVSGYPLFIKPEWLINNPYYEDHCCGLFGNSGTHILSFFSVFVFVYDMYLADYVLKNGKRMKIFIFLSTFWMLFLSTMNDNNGIFVLYIIFIVKYYTTRIMSSNLNLNNKIIQYLKYFLVILVLIMISVNLPGVNIFVRNVLLRKLSSMLKVNSGNLMGSNERLAIATTALSEGFGWRLGIGIASHQWTSGMFYGFSHFGLSSIGSIIFLCGIWFYLYLCILYSKLFAGMNLSIKKQALEFVSVFAIVVIVSVFTTIFTFSLCMIWLAFLFSVISFIKGKNMVNV